MSDDEGNVEVPKWVLRECLRELEHAIERTGGEDPGWDGANSPLSEARSRVMNAAPGEAASAEFWASVLDAFDDIAEERGVQMDDVDPLTDRTFRARNELQDILEAADDSAST